jgi:hypothetical protein
MLDKLSDRNFNKGAGAWPSSRAEELYDVVVVHDAGLE